MSAAKFKLEEEFADIQKMLADRSTDSEASSRQEELFHLKEEVQDLLRKLSHAQQQCDGEIAGLKFGKEQDLKEARARVCELEGTVSQLEMSLDTARPGLDRTRSENEDLLHVKIEQLRTERDDLRRSKSFGEHEHHFALNAAVADRDSALDDIEKAHSQLLQKSTAYDSLEAEVAQLKQRLDDVSTRLETVSASFAAASTEKNDLADRISHLELELRHATAARNEFDIKVKEATAKEVASLQAHHIHHEQLVDLASRLAIEQSERSKAQNALVTSNKARSDLEARVDQLGVKIDELQKAQPGDMVSSSSNGHVRSRSTLPSPTLIQELLAEKTDLQGRLQRRIRKASCFFLGNYH